MPNEEEVKNDTKTVTDPKDQQHDVSFWLNRSYLYQNKTGKASSTTLSTRQLCRILCPSASVVVSSSIHRDTMVLGFDGETYEKEWKAAKNVEVLRESCAEWYVSREKVEGPLTCRAVARLFQEGEIKMETKVWSSSLENTSSQAWSCIHELPYLQAAIAAFETTKPTWNVPAADGENAVESTNGSAASQQYDSSIMTYDAYNGTDDSKEKEVQDELEAFLSSTAAAGFSHEEEDEVYESDGGTVYAKCPNTGNWIHSDLVASKPNKEVKETPSNNKNKKKRKKPKFSAKNQKCWIYVTGLPSDDCNEAELVKFFQKVGILDLNPETQKPKIKLYRQENGKPKGDASICYARPESVELAIQLLDEAPFRLEDPTSIIKVQRAKFEQHGDYIKQSAVSNAKRKVAKLAAIQAVDWDESDNGRISGGRKGLCIIVLKYMFDPSKSTDTVFERLEKQVHTKCQQWGSVEKITIFSKHPDGVVIVKFVQPTAASTAIQEYDGLVEDGREIKASFWDGVTDYTVKNEENDQSETKKRLDEFGEWLEGQEVPEELKLQVEGQS